MSAPVGFAARVLRLTGPFNGRSGQMTRNAAGDVVVGIGSVLGTAQTARALSWYKRAGGNPTPTEISNEWTNVKNAVAGQLNLFLKYSEMVRLFGLQVDTLYGQGQSFFPEWDTWPEAVRVAVIDLAFDLGAAGVANRKALSDALKARDWTTASLNCDRPNGRAERTAYLQALFLASVGL